MIDTIINVIQLNPVADVNGPPVPGSGVPAMTTGISLPKPGTVGFNPGVIKLAYAGMKGPPLRVLVRNLGLGVFGGGVNTASGAGGQALLAYRADDLATPLTNPMSSPDIYRLPWGSADTFILAPGQALFGATQSAATVSVAVSECMRLPKSVLQEVLKFRVPTPIWGKACP